MPLGPMSARRTGKRLSDLSGWLMAGTALHRTPYKQGNTQDTTALKRTAAVGRELYWREARGEMRDTKYVADWTVRDDGI